MGRLTNKVRNQSRLVLPQSAIQSAENLTRASYDQLVIPLAWQLFVETIIANKCLPPDDRMKEEELFKRCILLAEHWREYGAAWTQSKAEEAVKEEHRSRVLEK